MKAIKDVSYDLLIAEIDVFLGKGDREKVARLKQELKELGVPVNNARVIGASQAANVVMHGSRNRPAHP